MANSPISSGDEIKHQQSADFISSESGSESESELRIMAESPNPERFISDLTEPSTSQPSNYVTTLVSKRPAEARSRMAMLQSSSDISKQIHSKSFSESSDSDSELGGGKKSPKVEGEYQFGHFENLQVSGEIQDLFQHIKRYTPQKIELDYKFKPFIPEFIPAIGDTDAFLKVVIPEKSWTGDVNDKNKLSMLGLEVLDEPSAAQSDAALLYLRLRAASKNKKSKTNLNVKKIENVSKNSKAIDQWINDIGDLHSSHPPPSVILRNSMPTVDELLQDWTPEEVAALRDGFPDDKINCSLQEYVELVCSIFDIPIYESRIESLHVLFSMCLAVKNYYLYINRTAGNGAIDVLEVSSVELAKKESQTIIQDDSDDNDQVVFY